MASRQVTICNDDGLHARPAAKFVKLASEFSCEIYVEKDGEEINGKSIMGLMMIAAAQGTVLTLTAEGEDEEKALTVLAELVESGFGE